MRLWPRQRTEQEEKEDIQKKEEIEQSVAWLKAQLKVIDSRVKVLEQQHEENRGTASA